MMSHSRKQSRGGRRPSGDVAKKVVSLTIDPVLIKRVDAYASDKRMSRSAAIETAILGLLAPKSGILAKAENSVVQPDCAFATPSLGSAIHY